MGVSSGMPPIGGFSMAVKQRRLSDRFAFASQLQSVKNERDLLTITRDEVERTTGYHRCWLYLLTPDRSAFELMDVAGPVPSEFHEHCLILPVAGDSMLEEIATGTEPVVVVDARLDPRTDQEMVKKTGSVTLITIPVRLPDYPLGGMGTGTFTEEGARPPTEEELLTLVDIADQVAIALARIRNQAQRQSAQREQDRLLFHLAQLKRQESAVVLASGLVQEQSQLLDAALGCLAKLEEEGLNPAQASDLRNLRRTLEQMRELSAPLAKFGKRRPAEILPVDLNDRLTEILSIVSRLLPSGMVVQTEFEANLPKVLGDPSMLDDVFLNLLLTAKEYLPPGATLSLHTRANEGWVESEMRLSGLPSTFAVGSGLEMNLDWDLCDYILRQHQGSLECDSSSPIYRCLVRLPAQRDGARRSRPGNG
ncbi:GAF domain-containing protein [bacterium]|nr:GAF domain-containing protein [bacterium]